MVIDVDHMVWFIIAPPVRESLPRRQVIIGQGEGT
jgi:hypothetical protein